MNIVNAVKSICRDNSHIILWDFDGVCYNEVYKNLKKIQKIFYLPNIYLIKTTYGFNAFCLVKLPFELVYEIKCNTPKDDYYHSIFGFNLGGWCLRMGNDKKYLGCLDSPVICLCSNPHRLFFSKFFNIDIEGLFDGEIELTLNRYIRSK